MAFFDLSSKCQPVLMTAWLASAACGTATTTTAVPRPAEEPVHALEEAPEPSCSQISLRQHDLSVEQTGEDRVVVSFWILDDSNLPEGASLDIEYEADGKELGYEEGIDSSVRLVLDSGSLEPGDTTSVFIVATATCGEQTASSRREIQICIMADGVEILEAQQSCSPYLNCLS